MKLIIFDVYGTLISTGTGSLDAANANLFINEEAVFTCDLKQLYLKYDICRDAGSDVNIMLDTLGKRKCFDETLSSIENLRKRYRVVIGSTTDNNPLYQDLERNGLVVDEVYTSEMIRKYKPDPEFIMELVSE